MPKEKNIQTGQNHIKNEPWSGKTPLYYYQCNNLIRVYLGTSQK